MSDTDSLLEMKYLCFIGSHYLEVNVRNIFSEKQQSVTTLDKDNEDFKLSCQRDQETNMENGSEISLKSTDVEQERKGKKPI